MKFSNFSAKKRTENEFSFRQPERIKYLFETNQAARQALYICINIHAITHDVANERKFAI